MTFKQFISGEFIDDLFYMGNWYSSVVGSRYKKIIDSKHNAFCHVAANKKRKSKKSISK